MGKSSIEQLEKLRKKRDQLNAQIQSSEARETKKKRALDARKKILIGAAVLEAIGRGTWDQKTLTELLDAFLSRPIDRELFDLPRKEQS